MDVFTAEAIRRAADRLTFVDVWNKGAVPARRVLWPPGTIVERISVEEHNARLLRSIHERLERPFVGGT